ncbi:MAG TPA: AMMECR1 domain-containing protein [Gammaproteobacteria bacterium]|nr:AMMECR1 domain-containing protein [Gammaproteobacteria bacterium]
MSSDTEPSPLAELTPEEKTLLLQLARQAISLGVETRKKMATRPAHCSPSLLEPCACFVTLHLHGVLRGCIGTLEAEEPLVDAVVTAAYNAALADPRFSPVTAEELPLMEIEISVLSPAEPLNVESESELLSVLQPGVDGLTVEEGVHRATFLPTVWQQLPTPAEFFHHLKLKAGLADDYWSDRLSLSRYRSETFAE